jgi:hypothetical protein
MKIVGDQAKTIRRAAAVAELARPYEPLVVGCNRVRPS